MRFGSGLLVVAATITVAGITSAQAAQPACDRACLEGFVDRYLDAVAVNKPSMVPLSPNVRFTEDGQRLLIGDGLWNTMKGKGTYRLFGREPSLPPLTSSIVASSPSKPWWRNSS